jgi:hypothetical protein
MARRPLTVQAAFVTGCGVELAIEDIAAASDSENRTEFKAENNLPSFRNQIRLSRHRM